MAEVAGTAVGIISLGLQVCQGLVSYYEAYQGQDEKVADILRDMSALSSSLKAIQRCLSKLKSGQLDTIAQAGDSVVECAAVIKRLEALLAECHRTTIPADFKERMKILARKAAFPFRQSTIKDLKDTVKGLQTNIVVALQILEIELSSHLSDYSAEILNHSTSTSAGITRVRNDVSGLGTQIHDIHSSLPGLKNDTRDLAQSIGRSSTQIATGLTVVDHSMSTLNQQVSTLDSDLNHNFSALKQSIDCLPGVLENRILATLEMYSNRQAHSTASQCSSLDSMALQANNLQMELLRKPSLLQSVCNRAAELQRTTNELLSDDRGSSAELGLSGVQSPSKALCSCMIGSTYESRNWSNGFLNLYRSSVISCIHQKGCPLRISPRKRTITGMRYSYCGLWLSQMLSFSISMSRGAGGSSISPNITFRAIVPDKSPAFSLFDPVACDLEKINYYSWVTQELYHLFTERKASPSDVNSREETLLHVAVKTLHRAQNDIQGYKDLILSLLAWGVDYNETNNDGERPLDKMIATGVLASDSKAILTSEPMGVLAFDSEAILALGLELLDKGLEFSDSWLLDPDPFPWWGIFLAPEHFYISSVTYLVRFRLVNEVLDGLRCGRLSRALLSRSETQVTEIVDKFPDSLRERNSMGHTPMHLAANWPAGVSILLNAGANNLVNERDNVGFLPVAYATHLDCLASVQLLVGADCASYGQDLLDEYSYLHEPLWDSIGRSSDEVAKFFLQALVDRRRRLAGIASQELPCSVKKSIDILPDKVIDASAALVYSLLKQNHVRLPPSLAVPSGWQTIYHLLHSLLLYSRFCSPTYWADLFYNAGFHDFTGYDASGRNVLMDIFYRSVSDDKVPVYLDLYLWYLRKGVKLGHKNFRMTDEGDWISHTPGAFYVGSFIVEILSLSPLIERNSTQLRSLLTKVVAERTSDDCKCGCSINGCDALTSMLKERRRYQTAIYREPDQDFYQFPILLANLLNITNDGWTFFPAEILRFLTFERLEMTHTCCVYHEESWCHDYFSVFDDNNRVEIQEEESADLEQLESLMLEFRRAYTDLGASLPDFLQGYWTTRMDHVMSEEAIREDEATRIRELGVTWEPRKQRYATPNITRHSDDAGGVMDDENLVFPPAVEGPKRRHSF